MMASLPEADQLLGGISSDRAERLVTSLANADLPDSQPATNRDSALLRRLRAQTQKYWPDLWELGNECAVEILRKVRQYLQAFWKTQDPHDRDWYLYRARESYWLSRVDQLNPNVTRLRQEFDKAATADEAREASSWLNINIGWALDKAPARTPFEESLFHLQGIAGKTRFCPNPQCQAPYFIATKKGQKFCSPGCARPTLLQSKRNYWKDKHGGLNEQKKRRSL
jgi:hypothetical protein